MNQQIIIWISNAIGFGTVLGLASLGETTNEKSGHLNLGIPGIMYFAAIVSYICVMSYEKGNASPNAFLAIVIAILSAFAVGSFLGFIYTLICATFKCNQNVMGLAMTTFGVGFGKFLSSAFKLTNYKLAFTGSLFNAAIPGLKDIPFVGPAFFNNGFMTYILIALCVCGYIFFNKTKTGLNLRAVGEFPATADAAGINVMKYKYIATIVGCGLAGLAGMTYVMAYSQGLWATNNDIEAIGWLAVALVIFVVWKPIHLLWGAPLFGFFYWAYLYLPMIFPDMGSFVGLADLLQMLPYVVTIIILLFNSMRKKRENQPPASLGIPYFREER